MAKLASLFLVFFAVASQTADAVVCNQGWQPRTGVDASYCPTLVATSCKSSITCCTAVETCSSASASISCDSNQYNKADSTPTGGANTRTQNCCVAKATCAADTCPSTSGHIANAANSAQQCTSGVSSCSATTCCKLDPTLCAAWFAAPNQCATGKSRRQVTTTGTDANACCVDNVMCNSHTCPSATHELMANAATTTCLYGVCTNDQCCQSKTCAVWEMSNNCPTGKTALQGSTAGTDANACCADNVMCSSHTCPAATHELITNAANTVCQYAACANAQCCQYKSTICGGTSGTCGANRQVDAAKINMAVNSDYSANCCSAKAQCKDTVAATGGAAATVPAFVLMASLGFSFVLSKY